MTKRSLHFLILAAVMTTGCGARHATSNTVARTDQPEKLLDISLHAKSYEVRGEAERKLFAHRHDFSEKLKQIALHSEDHNARGKALWLVPDAEWQQRVLEDPNWSARLDYISWGHTRNWNRCRRLAVRNFTSYPALIKIVATGGMIGVAAECKMTDQEKLKKLSVGSKELFVRMVALECITDQEFLLKALDLELFDRNSSRWYYRCSPAMTHCTDSAVLLKIAENYRWSGQRAIVEKVQAKAATQLNDPESLKKLITMEGLKTMH
jgi:hypothetical protein